VSTLTVRPFQPGDAPALTEILNAIIAVGGTTAYTAPLSVEDLRRKHLDGPTVLCCHTVLDADQPAGFQVLNANPTLPEGWGDIASFTRQNPPLRGAGTALFQATQTKARALRLVALNATIRADNVPGLSYYTKMGFADRDRVHDVALGDGTRVDRVRKTYPLGDKPVRTGL